MDVNINIPVKRAHGSHFVFKAGIMKNLFRVILAVLIAISFIPFNPIEVLADTAFIDVAGEHNSTQVMSSDNIRKAQQFNVTATVYITKVKVYGQSFGSITLNASIKSVDGDGKPTGAALTSGSTAIGVGTEQTSIDLTGYTLSPGQYVLVISRTGASQYSLWGSNGTLISGATMWSSSDAGATWTDTGFDFMEFEAWGALAPVVETDAATSVTTTSAILNGDLLSLGNESSVNVYFGWRTATGGVYDYYTAPVTKTTTGAFNTTLTGLTPGDTYYYAAFVSNATTSWYGDETSFTMDDNLAVTTNDASYITTGTAVLNGNLTNLGNHTSVEVGFEYGNTTGMTNSIEAFQSPLITTSTFSIPAGMFNGNETIYFRAYATADGTTVYGENKTFITLPSGPVNNLTVVTEAATGLGDTNATLNGNLTAIGNYVPTVGFRYGEFLGFWREYMVGSQSSTGTFSYNLTGLRAGTTYYFQAIAKDAQTGNYTPREGSILSFTTTGTKTPSTTMQVTTGLGYPLSDSQVRFTGSLDEMGTNTRVYVGFDWGLTTGYGNVYNSPTPRTSEGGFDYILSGLTAGQTIHFRAGAFSDTGDVAWGADQTVVVGQYVAPGSPTPTVTPPSGTGTPTPIGPITLPGSWNTTLGRYILLVVLLVSAPLLLMYILGGTLGRGLSGLVDAVIFTAWVIQGWIDLWILVTVLIVAGFIVWKTILSPRGA